MSICRPAAAAPIEPETNTRSPGRAPCRRSACRRLTVPDTVTSTMRGPGDWRQVPAHDVKTMTHRQGGEAFDDAFEVLRRAERQGV